MYSMSRGEAGGEGEREFEAGGSMPSVEPDTGFHLTTVIS